MAKHQNIYLNVCPITPSSGASGGPSTHSAAPAATTHDTSVDAATTPSPSPRRRRGPLSTRWGVPAHRGGVPAPSPPPDGDVGPAASLDPARASKTAATDVLATRCGPPQRALNTR